MYVTLDDGHAHAWTGSVWSDLGEFEGPVGPQGIPGLAATITVGTTNTGAPGTNARVTNSGNTTTAVFDFIIPRGDPGLTPFTTTALDFVIPAYAFTVDVTATGDVSWVQPGMVLWVENGSGGGRSGDLTVTAVNGQVITLRNDMMATAPGGGDMLKTDFVTVVPGSATVDRAWAVPWTGIENVPLVDTVTDGIVPKATGQIVDYFAGNSTWKSLLVTLAQELVPVGTVIDFAGPTPPPSYLPADGRSLPRASYPALFAALGTSWGAVDGASFNLPDLRGRATISQGTGPGLSARGLGQVGGEEAHALTWPENGPHYHNVTINDPTHAHDCYPGISDPGHAHVGGAHQHLVMDHSHGASVGDPQHRHDYANALQAGASGWGAQVSPGYVGGGDITSPAGTGISVAIAGCGNQWTDTDVAGRGQSWTDARGTGVSIPGFWSAARATGITASSDTQGSGTGHNTMMPFGVVSKCIKVT
jgi:microcystin-dependent protein